METIPNPASPEAVVKGCTCDPKQNNPGKLKGPFWIIDPKCPVHGGISNLMSFADQQRKKRKGVR